jgi:hypothetical protein
MLERRCFKRCGVRPLLAVFVLSLVLLQQGRSAGRRRVELPGDARARRSRPAICASRHLPRRSWTRRPLPQQIRRRPADAQNGPLRHTTGTISREQACAAGAGGRRVPRDELGRPRRRLTQPSRPRRRRTVLDSQRSRGALQRETEAAPVRSPVRGGLRPGRGAALVSAGCLAGRHSDRRPVLPRPVAAGRQLAAARSPTSRDPARDSGSKRLPLSRASRSREPR